MKLDDYLKLEQTKDIYTNLPTIIAGTVSVCTLNALVFLFGDFDRLLVFLWWFAVLVLVTLRWLSSRSYRAEAVTLKNYKNWLNLTAFWSFLGGIHWGLISILFFEDDLSAHAIFAVFVLTGYVASAISTNAAFPMGFVAFACPAVLLFSAQFFYRGGEFQNALGAMIVFYFLVTCLLSRNAKRTFDEGRKLNFKNLELMDELRVQKSAAEEATVSKDRFLASASHDLRQPLHSAGLLISALEPLMKSDESKALLDDLKLSNKALNNSFNSLLDMSRLDAGVVQPVAQHFALDRFIESISRDYQYQAQNNSLSFEISGEPIYVKADPLLLERVLSNLFSNAVRYTEQGKISVVWQSTQDGRVRLLVQDTGIGINAEQLSEIFSEYYQVANPARDRSQGFGLGLAIVRRLCDIMKIPIYVTSQLGEGTIFAVYLTQGDSVNAAQQQERKWSITDLSGVQVLVIDDDHAILNSMRKLLESWGCKVQTSDSREDAEAQVAESSDSPDIVIADHRLQDNITGVEVIAHLKREFDIDFASLVVTGDTSPERLQQLRSSGFTVLHKPVAPAALRAAIQRQLLSR